MATKTKKDKFYSVLKNIFIGAKIEGNSGYVNLMRIKNKYYQDFKGQLATDIDKKLDEVGRNFEEELYNKLFTFFKKYFSESGSIYFTYTPLQEKVYERIYRDDKDVMLFWKTNMLYYVKTERLYQNMDFQDEDNQIWYHFDVSELEHKKNNEKKELIFEYAKSWHEDNKREIFFKVKYSKNGSKTKIEDILKKVKKSTKAFGSYKEQELKRALGIFRKQSEVDYFINKNAKEFLQEQFSLWIKTYVFDDNTIFEEARLQQLKALRDIAYNIIDLVSQFEDELVKIWNKPKFAHSSNYVITLDKIADKDFTLLEKLLKHKGITEQIKEWQELGIADNKFNIEDVFETNAFGKQLIPKWQYLPIDTKYFKDLELIVLALFDDLDNQLDGWLLHSENYQALNTLKHKFYQKVDTVFIDPPFNLGSNADFQYMVNYKDATWASLLESRLRLAKILLKDTGSIFVRCDYNGNQIVRMLLDDIFGKENLLNEIIISRGRNESGSPSKLETTTEVLFFYGKSKFSLKKITTKRSIANIQWTGFTMGGDRNPPERIFLGKTIYPKKGQHFSLIQPKVDKLLNEKYIRLKCKNCGTYYYKAKDDRELGLFMKKKTERFKFYDITSLTKYHGVEKLEECDCGETDNFDIQYLGSEDVFLNNNWLDIESYSNSNNFSTENSETLLQRVINSSTEKDGLIIDFFTGSATTQSAAQKLGRKWIGVEMGQQFYDVDIPRLKQTVSGRQSGISKDLKPKYKGSGFFKYKELEQYEEALRNAKYEDKGALPKDIYHQYLFFKDLKLADEVIKLDDESRSIKVDLAKLHDKIDIPETLSFLTGKFIKQIYKDKVVFTDGSEIEYSNIDYKIVKPLIWW